MVKMDTNLYITVPILQNFDQDIVIGSLSILKSELPSNTDFTFSISFRALETIVETNGRFTTNKYELMSVSPITDDSYIKYVQYMG